MATREAKIWAALRDRLETYSGLPANVVYAGESFDAPDPSVPYLIVDDVRFDPRRDYWRGPNWRTGNLGLMCMVPQSWTYSQTVEYGGKLAEHFPEDTVMTYSDVEIRVSLDAYMTGTVYRDGSHVRVPIIVPWEGHVE